MKPGIRKRLRFSLLLSLAAIDALLMALGKVGVITVLIAVVLLSVGIVVGARLLLRHSKLIWRLRNRLIVTYVFVGVVPIVIILALAFMGTWIVTGQIAAYLIGSELSRRAAALENPARFLSEATPKERAEIGRQLGLLLKEKYPDFEVLITGGGEPYRYPETSTLTPPPEGWSKFTGVVVKDRHYYLMGLARTGAARAVIIAPLSQYLLEHLMPGLGRINIGGQWAGKTPEAANDLDFEATWFSEFEAAQWDQPNRTRISRIEVGTRPSLVLAVVFGDRPEQAQVWLTGFAVAALLLAIVELLSVVVSGSITNTITGAVDNLYEGTVRIARGDFRHRIPVKGRDQLAALGRSFNEMSSQLEDLVRITREKDRLESELSIASDVQNQLFPRSTPRMKTIELVGACEPARSVSGDYYDYLCLPDGNLAVAFGDVAGKGISAALLMASIQSIMRTVLAQGVPANFSTSAVVEQLNRQLYANTSPEKYATFFFGLYDEASRTLTYTNAGHLPPLLVCDGQAKPLEVTGTVVGLFPSMKYREKTIVMHHDDMLVAYTDGITEPENAYGEEFGVDRLAECVLRNRACEPREIVAKAMEAVKHWSHSEELPDDMTVLVAKGIA